MLRRLSVLHILSIAVLFLTSLVGAIVLPSADTPLFYLVSSNAHSTHFNLQVSGLRYRLFIATH